MRKKPDTIKIHKAQKQLKNNKLNWKKKFKYKIIKKLNYIYIILKRIKDKKEVNFD